MSLIIERAGEVQVRVGGNTQDYATLVGSTVDGKAIEKQSIDPNNPVSAPYQVIRMCPSLSTMSDRDANDHLHGGASVHVEQYLLFSEREVVPWCVPQY